MSQKTQGAIAAGHPKTAEAGLEMFRLGGNAFDAAIAAVLASFVAEAALTSPAGGGFLLAHTQDRQNILFDFFTQTPRSKKQASQLDFYPVDVNFGDAIQEFHIGLGAMAVPGNVAGIFHVHQKLGKLPFSVVAEPAIHYAKTGVELSDFQYYCLTILRPIITANAEFRQLYVPNGELVKPGDLIVLNHLADTLTTLVKQGPQEFYQGAIAHQLVQDCQQFGGHLTLEDLSNYQVIERNPLAVNYRTHTLLTNPPPGSGGTLIAFALNLLAQIDLTNFRFGSAEHLQMLTTIMRLTNVARKDGYDANLYQENVADQFLSTAYLQQYYAQLNQILNLPNLSCNKWGSTTHISVIDQAGNAASVTTSHGEGCGYVIPGTGIMMNNMLGEEDLNPHGFHQWQADVRISSMMSPTMVLQDERPEIVVGSGGSNRIRTAILQVISNLIDFRMPIDLAVDSPRIHWENQILNLEPGWSAALQDAALPTSDRFVQWTQKNMFFGGVHTVRRTETGQLEGAGDRRRSGVALTC